MWYSPFKYSANFKPDCDYYYIVFMYGLVPGILGSEKQIIVIDEGIQK